MTDIRSGINAGKTVSVYATRRLILTVGQIMGILFLILIQALGLIWLAGVLGFRTELPATNFNNIGRKIVTEQVVTDFQKVKYMHADL